MDQTLHIHEISLGIGLVGIGVILWALARAIVQLVATEYASLRGEDARERREALRRHFGYYLLLGLEFLVAADIVDTILKPSLEELAVLGAIVAIRTVISFSLSWELAGRSRAES
ncbi:MAG: DUF1622 domain-containing protein [Gemmatimonadales bacterium]